MASIAFGARPVTQINAADWATLEEAGCIFLPGASYRNFSGSQPSFNEAYSGRGTDYWSATANNASQAHNMYFNINGRTITPTSNESRYTGMPVRLVQDL